MLPPLLALGLWLTPPPWPTSNPPGAALADDDGGGGRDGGDRGDRGGDDRGGGDRGDRGGDRDDDGDDGDDRGGGSGRSGDDRDDGDDRGGRDGRGGGGAGDDRGGGGGRGFGGGFGGDDDRGGRGFGRGGFDDDDDRGGGGRGLGRPGFGDEDDDDDDDDDAREDDDAAPRRAPRGVEPPSFVEALSDLFAAGPSEGRDVVAREFLGLDLTAAELAALSSAGYATVSTRSLGGLQTTLHRFRAPSGVGLEAALDEAREIAPDATFDYNHLYPGAGAGCSGPACWGARLTEISALSSDACVRGAPVAIVDTAVDVSHPALKGARIETRSFLPPGVVPAPDGHGTAVAALLVGRLSPEATPLAPGARLLAAEAFALRGDVQRADAAAVIAALDWALENRARVVSFSMAGAPNLLLGRAVALASERANLIAAAGNGGPDAGPAYPAAYPEVIAVAALDRRKRVWRNSNRGGYVELAAPGVDVLSAAPDGGLAAWTGTSFAAPFVAAAALRARAVAGGDPEAARRLLADAAEDIGAPGRDPMAGHGLVQSPGRACW